MTPQNSVTATDQGFILLSTAGLQSPDSEAGAQLRAGRDFQARFLTIKKRKVASGVQRGPLNWGTQPGRCTTCRLRRPHPAQTSSMTGDREAPVGR